MGRKKAISSKSWPNSQAHQLKIYLDARFVTSYQKNYLEIGYDKPNSQLAMPRVKALPILHLKVCVCMCVRQPEIHGDIFPLVRSSLSSQELQHSLA